MALKRFAFQFAKALLADSIWKTAKQPYNISVTPSGLICAFDEDGNSCYSLDSGSSWELYTDACKYKDSIWMKVEVNVRDNSQSKWGNINHQVVSMANMIFDVDSGEVIKDRFGEGVPSSVLTCIRDTQNTVSLQELRDAVGMKS